MYVLLPLLRGIMVAQIMHLPHQTKISCQSQTDGAQRGDMQRTVLLLEPNERESRGVGRTSFVCRNSKDFSFAPLENYLPYVTTYGPGGLPFLKGLVQQSALSKKAVCFFSSMVMPLVRILAKIKVLLSCDDESECIESIR